MSDNRPQPTGRRERWADQENARRGADHAARLAHWQRIDSELADLIRRAWGSLSASPAAEPEEFALQRGEQILGRVPNIRLVSIARPPGTSAPGYGGYSPLWTLEEPSDAAQPEAAQPSGVPGGHPPEAGLSILTDRPDGPARQDGQVRPEPGPVHLGRGLVEERYQPLESGRITITNQRLVFHGSRDHEWPLGRVVRMEHAQRRPLTLIHLAHRRRISGLEYDGPKAASMRFLLTLAMAHHTGDIDGFVGHLEAERERHDLTRPPAPPLVSPDDAPGRAALAGEFLQTGLTQWRRQPTALRVAELCAVVGSVVLLGSTLLSAGGQEPDRVALEATPPAATALVDPQLTDVASTDSPTATTTAAASSTVPTPTPTPTPSPTPTRTPTPTATRTSVPTSAAPTVDLCGAPANPFGYNFCGQGQRIYDPSPQVCNYFSCVEGFGESSGYLVECEDHTVSDRGGRGRACSHHGGVARTVSSGS